MQEAYSHEVASVGFWPGTGLGDAAFYSYAYPEPPGYRDTAVLPAAASYHPTFREFILLYEVVRLADDPEAMLMDFLQSTYEAAANVGNWPRSDLERDATFPR